MTSDCLSKLLASLSAMQSGRENPWCDAVMDNYTLALADLPDRATIPLMRAILKVCRWRPSPAEVIAMWEQIDKPHPIEDVTTALAFVKGLMHKYGRYGAVHSRFPERFPIVRDVGEPPELANAPARTLAVIAAFGGYVAMCDEQIDEYVFRSQFERMWKAAGETEAAQKVRAIALGETHHAQIETQEAAQLLAGLGWKDAADK